MHLIQEGNLWIARTAFEGLGSSKMRVGVMSGYENDVTKYERHHARVDAKALCNLFLDWSESDGIPLSPMKLQKLLYFCHADYLAEFQLPLLKQSFEAWDFGPVVPSIYREFKKFGDKAVVGRATTFDPVTASSAVSATSFTPEFLQTLRYLFDRYKSFSAITLSHLSHMPRGPWRHARSLFANGLNADRKISDDMILRFHELSGV